MSDTPSEFDKLLHYLFTTACEGGINYWASIHGYHWSQGARGEQVEDWTGFGAKLDSTEGDWGRDEPIEINRATMAAGYRLATTEWRNKIAWSTDAPPLVASDALEDWDFDAGDADVILQLGVFGDVIYG